jgi:MFS family permease
VLAPSYIYLLEQDEFAPVSVFCHCSTIMLVRVWHSYSAGERRNIAIYIAGIMFYKLGLEFFNGSITTLATDRFKAANTFTKLGAAQGLNQAAQCVGAILIAPLIKRWPTRTVLASAICFFSLMTAILLIVDAATG